MREHASDCRTSTTHAQRGVRTKRAAEYLGVSLGKVRDFVHDGLIVPITDNGGAWVFDLCDLNDLIERLKQT